AALAGDAVQRAGVAVPGRAHLGGGGRPTQRGADGGNRVLPRLRAAGRRARAGERPRRRADAGRVRGGEARRGRTSTRRSGAGMMTQPQVGETYGPASTRWVGESNVVGDEEVAHMARWQDPDTGVMVLQFTTSPISSTHI